MRHLMPDDFCNKYMLYSFIIAILFIINGFVRGVGFEAIAVVLSLYFILMLILAILLETQGWWGNSSPKTKEVSK